MYVYIIYNMKTFTLRYTPPENTPLPSPAALGELLVVHQLLVAREDHPYTHYHFYLKTDLSIVTLRKRFKTWCSATGNKEYSIHTVDGCVRHTNCLKYSLPYCLKNSNIIYRLGVSKAQVKRAQDFAQELKERKELLKGLKGKPSWFRCYVYNKVRFDNIKLRFNSGLYGENRKLIFHIVYTWYNEFHNKRPTEHWCSLAVENICCYMFPSSAEKHYEECWQYVLHSTNKL